jgi:lipoprotein NlpD
MEAQRGAGMRTRRNRTGPGFAFKVWLFTALIVSLLGLLAGCGAHQPAPVEERSTLVGKRQLNPDGTYTVRTGDTLFAIAFHYFMDPQELARWNGIGSPYVIHPGQKLRMMAPPPGSEPQASSAAVKVTAVKPRASVTTTPAPSRSTPPAQTTAKAVEKPVAAQKQAAPIEADPDSWIWPTKGRVLRGYVANNPSRNGLDITGQEGQPIKASAPGQVVYSGNGLIGYGELIIVRHSEKMLSAYAHNKVRLVGEGDQVTAGQKIAEMGRNTGNETMLHFEIRVRGKPVNPLSYLPKN